VNRRILLPATLAAAALLLTSCASAAPAADAPEEAEGGVTLVHPTLDGLEISFDAQPESLVMDCYAYSSLHEYGLEPDAIFGYDCENPFVMGDADISGIERVGQDGEINLEKLAELRPDAVIGQGTADGWNWFDEDVNAQLTRVASFIPLPSGVPIDDGIAATREVAEFLGADVASDAIVRSDEDLAEAKQAFSDAIAGTDLNIMLASPVKEMLYTGVGFAQADLLEELGATIVGADAPESGNPWGQVAWEDASSYPADIILVEGYSDDYAFTADLWETMPAVEAAQLGSWGSKGAMTASAYADWLNEVASLVESSRKVS
jgi:iron complex transport system substrate-binding protein